jgi:pimeloyl-ACP methyl ester carboxylesterase
MPSVSSHGVDIHWESAGEGLPVVLVHGFGESIEGLWRSGGWLDALVDSGYRYVALEFRGHGQSGHPYEPDAYHIDKLVDDLAAVVRAADAGRGWFVGFSLGSEILMRFLLRDAPRARGAVFIAMGKVSLKPRRKATALTAEALVTEDLSEIHPALRKMRRIHEERGNDLRALSALLSAEVERVALVPEQLGALRIPTLFLNGEHEQVVGDAREIAQHVEGSRVGSIEGCYHDETPRSPLTRREALAFFAES